MSFDLDDVLDAASSGAPCLVEVARDSTGARTAYFWSSGRIQATCGPKGVRIKRRFGNMGTGDHPREVRLDAEEVRLLAIACRDWARRRERWAAFYFTCAGYPGGMGGAYYYLAPGRKGQVVQLGTSTIFGERGRGLRGRDEWVAVRPPVSIDERVVVTAEIWRRGEKHGPKEGSRVGLRYQLGPRLRLEARRNEARLLRGKSEVVLEPGEEKFVSALVGLAESRKMGCP